MPRLDELHRRLAALQGLIATVPDPLILVGHDGLVREANPAAQTLFPTLRIGHPLSLGVRAPDILEAVEKAPAGDHPVHVEYRERTPTARAFDVRICSLPRVSDGGEEDAGVSLVFRDLTAARRLEQMRVDFVANVSHELRTPLASLVGFIETLEGPAREDAAARERFLAIMRAQAWRMTRLIDDLLSLSRIELREHIAPEAPVELQGVVSQMVDTLRPMAAERGVTIALAMPDAALTVRGDRDELLRVVENLVENAVKYGESGGRVEVILEGDGKEAVLAVRDHGPGIAHEHLPRLTERFYRVDATQSREKGGTGLGLAIVKHIVNRHRGRLAIESEPGRGATFRVILPAAEG